MRAAVVFALASSLSAQVTYERILKAEAEPGNWLTYSGNYAAHRFSPLDSDQRPERREPEAAVGLSDELAAEVRDHAARRRRRDVHLRAAEQRHGARHPHRPAALEVPPHACRTMSASAAARSIAASRSSATSCTSAPSTRIWSR